MVEKGYKLLYGLYTLSLLGLVVSAALGSWVGALAAVVVGVVLVIVMFFRFRKTVTERSFEHWKPALVSAIAAVILFFAMLLKAGWEVYARVILAAGLALAFWLSPVIFWVAAFFLPILAMPFVQQPVQPYSSPPYEVMMVQNVQESSASTSQPYQVGLGTQNEFTGLRQDASWLNFQANPELDAAIDDLQAAYQIEDPLAVEFLKDLFDELYVSVDELDVWADLLVAGGALAVGLVMGKFILKRHEEFDEEDVSPLVSAYLPGMQALQGYFEHVPKSRLAEITYGTGLDKEKASALLELGRVFGQYTHEPACFWRPATEDEVIDRMGQMEDSSYRMPTLTDESPYGQSIFDNLKDMEAAMKEPLMLDPTMIPVLVQVLDFLFDETSAILKERRQRRKKQGKAEEKKTSIQAAPVQMAPESGEAILSKEAALSQMVRTNAWQNTEKQVEGLLEQLKIYQDRYRLYQKQYAIHGEAAVPFSVMYNLEEAEAGIETTSKELQAVLSKVYGKKVSIEGLDEL
jgi:hypothetical protein